MTIDEFKKWCDDKDVPGDARIILSHPGGYDNFIPDQYNEEEKVIIADGTG